MQKPNLIIFATGEPAPADPTAPKGGGSGMKNLIEASLDGRLNAEIAAVVCNLRGGGVEDKLHALKERHKLRIPFVHFPKHKRTPAHHQELVRELGGPECYVALSGCLWLVDMKESPEDTAPGLDPRFVFNIHPGRLPYFGGPGKWGHHVHEATIKAYREKQLYDSRLVTHSAVTMHFVTKHFDEGPVFFELPVPILPTDDAVSLGRAVNVQEQRFQPWVTDEVVNGRIRWDGHRPRSLITPMSWKFSPPHR